MLRIRPDLVRRDKLTDNAFGKLRIARLSKASFVRPWHLYVPQSAGGETRTATPEKGRTILETTSTTLSELLVELSATPWDERFPYA